MTASRPGSEAIFHAARDIPDPDRRREYIREACGGHQAWIDDVEALLAAADSPDSLLDHPAADALSATIGPPAIDRPTTESPGTLIGPYKLIEPIGEGGMGSVWMAQQTEPVKRLVALKLIKAGMDSRQVIARFEAERQALALMDHPNIARVLDGGTTGGGWSCSSRSARRCSTRIRRASSTATSSPPTCWWPPMTACRCPRLLTSAWPRRPDSS
jgi:hypothetical protein